MVPFPKPAIRPPIQHKDTGFSLIRINFASTQHRISKIQGRSGAYSKKNRSRLEYRASPARGDLLVSDHLEADQGVRPERIADRHIDGIAAACDQHPPEQRL